MSFLSGSKGKEKEKKAQFYVEFLGWMECRGVRGKRHTDPIITELQRRHRKLDSPPKLTVQVTAKELKITQDLEEKKKRGIRKIKFPAIPARDITYVVQATRPADGRPDDVVACIYLGYMPRTQRFVHVHVYRFDEPATAATFVRLMAGIVENNQVRINEIERDLVEKGEIEDPRLMSSDGMSDSHTHTGTDSAAGSGGSVCSDDSPPFGSEDMDADLQSLNDVTPFDSVANELKQRLKMGDGPLLLPPRDYDTISRARGNLTAINHRRCLNLHIVGQATLDKEGEETRAPEGAEGGQHKARNGSEESGIDLASPASESGDMVNRFGPQPQPQFNPSSPFVSSPGSNSPAVYPPSGMENGTVYPPRQERAISYRPDPISPSLHHHIRQSSQSSAFSAQSSRASHHSDNSGDNFPTFRRSNSNNSGTTVPAFIPVDDGFIPPTDYDDDDEPVTMRHAFSASGSGSQSGSNSPLLMRSLPAKVLHSELGLQAPHSPRNSRASPRVVGDEIFNAQRRSQPLYGSHGDVDFQRPHSTSQIGIGFQQSYEPVGMRRVNSTNR